ncbi:hypothetical protein ACLI4R_01035 [Natrialbaceae archaeon A-chndr2]
MKDSHFDVSFSSMIMIIVIWICVYSLSDIIAPWRLSNVVVAGFAGGVSFVLSAAYIQYFDD